MTEGQPERKLYRSRRDRMIEGVCGGLAEFWDVDPTLVRVAFVLLAALTSGGAILVYIVLMIVVPEEPIGGADGAKGDAEMSESKGSQDRSATEPAEPAPPPYTPPESAARSAAPPPESREPERGSRGSIIGGLVLVVLGVAFLLDRLVPGFNAASYWPVILIVIGIWIMVRPGKED